MRFARGKPGFTLIELLVVIAIVALLIGILLPALGKAREASKVAKCLANARSIGHALSMYADEQRDAMPYWSGWQVRGGQGLGDGDDSDLLGWSEQIEPFLSTLDAFVCPDRRVEQVPVAYFLQSRFARSLHPESADPFYTSVRLTQVAFSSQFVLTGDAKQRVLFNPPYGTSPHQQPNCDPDDARWPAAFWNGFGGELAPCHGGMTSIAFLDGHAGSFARFEPALMTWHGTRMAGWVEAGSKGAAGAGSGE